MRVELIEKIEGEAKLEYKFKENKIDFVKIVFPHYRGIEEILRNRPVWDALAINPRVCGICGHAHLFATVRAIENLYQNAGIDVNITEKAKLIREITLFCEHIQNHLKWIYLVIVPIMKSIAKINIDQNSFLEIQKAIVNINRVLAIFSGQWPHSSYMVPGGVVCDPTNLDIMQARNFLKNALYIVEKRVFENMAFEEITVSELEKSRTDSGKIFRFLKENSLLSIGKANDRYLIFGEHSFTKRVKIIKTVSYPVKIKYVKEKSQKSGFAKNVTYKNNYYETGPLARMMLLKPNLIKQLHRVYKDGISTRIFARVLEILFLLKKVEAHLNSIELSQKSYNHIKTEIKEGFGESAVEAARGSLIHKIWIEKNRIKKYEIITPTQWNLSNGTLQNPATAQKAMIGLKNSKLAELVFRTFDVCSVCTTH
ncbi:nickel-dependent hydrogenase large subunit [Nitrosophilus labii]|uniref:nickel-dependent hydrogenase large subunit n=1 Tax=Nitrosophilus labii TaxID=2706014 RepID=UPI0016574904|nr:nickel-dependent hydrogenase large subunit [Nitrosophilus labii]